MRPLIALLAAALVGCSASTGAPMARYDFGPAPAGEIARRLSPSLGVPPVAVASRLETPAMIYRLAYGDPLRAEVYAQSRWAAPPAVLLTTRLRERLARAHAGGISVPGDGALPDFILRVELDEFAQVFDTPEKSHGVLRARATLIDQKKRTVAGQKSFEFERAALTPDGAGGALALSQAADGFVDALDEWLLGVMHAK